MSPPPHREKDAKVEGRDPPETAPKKTMAPFKSLVGRLLNVKPDELAEQQRLYAAAQTEVTPKKRKKLKHPIGDGSHPVGQKTKSI